MKTIQQVIMELDSKEIENSFFYDHPINLLEVKDLDEITISCGWGVKKDERINNYKSILMNSTR